MEATRTTLSKQGGCHVYRPNHDNELVVKEGSRVRQSEADAMELVAKHTNVKTPIVVNVDFDNSKSGMLWMPFIEGKKAR